MPKRYRQQQPIQKPKEPYSAPKCVEAKGNSVSIWQRPDLKEQAQYRFENEPNPDVKRRRLALLEKQTGIFKDERVVVIVKNVTQQELDLIVRLRRAGIFTEMPFDFKLKTSKGRERGPMGFLNAGPTFSDFVSGKTAEEQRTLFMPVAHIIGRMHALGVEHGHVTMNNVHMYGSKLCLTDFSMAEQKRVDWNSTNSIYYAFIRDYSTRILRIGSVLDIQFCKEFFRRIVSNYPTSKKIKQELIELLDSDLRAHECTSFLPYSGPC